MGGKAVPWLDCLLVSVSDGYGGISHAPGTLAASGERDGRKRSRRPAESVSHARRVAGLCVAFGRSRARLV